MKSKIKSLESESKAKYQVLEISRCVIEMNKLEAEIKVKDEVFRVSLSKTTSMSWLANMLK